MSAEPSPLDVDELCILHALDQLLACLEDAGAALRRVQARGAPPQDPALVAALALVTLARRQLSTLVALRPPP